jgi:hypothetical protein
LARQFPHALPAPIGATQLLRRTFTTTIAIAITARPAAMIDNVLGSGAGIGAPAKALPPNSGRAKNDH